jgi:hypothetical protein
MTELVQDGGACKRMRILVTARSVCPISLGARIHETESLSPISD